MNVGLLCHRGIGGSVRITIELAGQLAARGHGVHLFARSAPFGLADPPAGVALHTLCDRHPVMCSLDSAWERADIEAMSELIAGVAAAAQLDVVHFHYAVPFAQVAELLAERLGPRGPVLLGTLHGTDVSFYGQDPEWRESLSAAFGCIDGLSTVSRSHAELATRLFGLAQAPLVLPDFIDTGLFRPAEPEEARPRERPRIVHISNFRAVKRPEMMARVLARVLAEVDADVWLVGDGDGMEAVCAILAGTEVSFLGASLEVEAILRHTDLMLVTSQAESFCMAALEAAACGVPTVAPRVGGLPELVLDGQTGLLFEPDDEHQARALVSGLVRDSVLRRRLGFAARRRAQLFSAAAVVPRYEEWYMSRILHRRAYAGHTFVSVP